MHTHVCHHILVNFHYSSLYDNVGNMIYNFLKRFRPFFHSFKIRFFKKSFLNMQVRFTRYLLINFHVSSPNGFSEAMVYSFKKIQKMSMLFSFTSLKLEFFKNSSSTHILLFE